MKESIDSSLLLISLTQFLAETTHIQFPVTGLKTDGELWSMCEGMGGRVGTDGSGGTASQGIRNEFPLSVPLLSPSVTFSPKTEETKTENTSHSWGLGLVPLRHAYGWQ